MQSRTFPAYTLVELLIALALSLLLLIGITELFQQVGGTMNETRSAMTASVHLNEAAMLLRQDLARIPSSLATKPKRIADYIADPHNANEVNDDDGYLMIVEGPQHPFNPDHDDCLWCRIYVDESNNPDRTAGDVDDIIGFTTMPTPALPFRGLVRGKIEERNAAEIVWFVRGNTLYRRVRLIDDVTRDGNNIQVFYNADEREFPSKTALDGRAPTEAGQYAMVKADETTDGGPQRYDSVMRDGNLVWTTLLSHEDLARRARRFGHDGLANNHLPSAFPYLLYAPPHEGWYYLRMPTLEETDYWSRKNIPFWKTETVTNPGIPNVPEVENPDLWNQPYFFPNLQDRKSGSLKASIESSRIDRAGDDVVLTNVLSFNVQVWDTKTKDFVDLGTPGTIWDDTENKQPALLHTWDSWTREYTKTNSEDGTVVLEPPPYAEHLEAVRITIRRFDPASRIIKQVTVIHRF